MTPYVVNPLKKLAQCAERYGDAFTRIVRAPGGESTVARRHLTLAPHDGTRVVVEERRARG